MADSFTKVDVPTLEDAVQGRSIKVRLADDTSLADKWTEWGAALDCAQYSSGALFVET